VDAKDFGTQSIVRMGIRSSCNLASLYGITYTSYSNIVGVVALVGWWPMPLAIVFVSTGYQIPEFVPPRFVESVMEEGGIRYWTSNLVQIGFMACKERLTQVLGYVFLCKSSTM
jgi:hypothetical protein